MERLDFLKQEHGKTNERIKELIGYHAKKGLTKSENSELERLFLVGNSLKSEIKNHKFLTNPWGGT